MVKAVFNAEADIADIRFGEGRGLEAGKGTCLWRVSIDGWAVWTITGEHSSENITVLL